MKLRITNFKQVGFKGVGVDFPRNPHIKLSDILPKQPRVECRLCLTAIKLNDLSFSLPLGEGWVRGKSLIFQPPLTLTPNPSPNRRRELFLNLMAMRKSPPASPVEVRGIQRRGI